MSKLTRIAVVDPKKCQPKKCNQECRRKCPVVSLGKECIKVEKTSKIADVSEILCNGCGICTRVCPYNAISIINLPKNLDSDITFRYGPNAFMLHRLPTPRVNQVLGIIGANGTGKSTALKLLSGKSKVNFGRYSEDVDWKEIITYFRGSDLQNYFQKLSEGDLKVVVKPQHVDLMNKVMEGKLVKECISDMKSPLIKELSLSHLLERKVSDLSGGETQRLAILLTCLRPASVYIFDESTSFLDVKERMVIARVIRSMCNETRYVIVVEHDLAVLDYMSDLICMMWGKPGAYGVVTLPSGVREGINHFITGYIPTENLRFRDEALKFRFSADEDEEEIVRKPLMTYPKFTKTLGDFKLEVESGSCFTSEVVVLLGENGTGKTTFVRLLAGILKLETDISLPELNISYKPQRIVPTFEGTVRELLFSKIASMSTNAMFLTDVMKPLQVPDLFDHKVKELSGGELQRVALTLCLGKPAQIYLIDEPSNFIDCEMRVTMAKVIRSFIMKTQTTAYIIEHDLLLALYMADRVMLFDGQPGISCHASSPQDRISGINSFLKTMDITYRRDHETGRPRVNKPGSIKDTEQKASGRYFTVEV